MRRAFRLGLRQDHLAAEVDDELAFHVEMRSRKLIATGLSAEAARREALRQFGDLQHVRASCVTFDEERERSMKRIRYADEFRQDIRFAVRALRRNPTFTAVAVFTLALGIGANTAIFTLINAILLRPIPVASPQQLIALGAPSRINSMSNGTAQALLYSYPLYRDVRADNRLVTGLLASGRTDRLDVRADAPGAEVEHPAGRFVSGNYFTVLGIAAARGRVFGALEDSIVGASPAIVISDRYWTRRFARDPQIVGRILVVDNVALTVVGVTPPGFGGEIVDRPIDVWIPITMQPMLQPHLRLLDDRHVSWLLLLGRLAHGVTVADAIAGFPPLVHRELIEHVLAPDVIANVKDQKVPVAPGAIGFSRVRMVYSAPLFTMMAAVGLLLFIVCANVANLLLARAIGRTPEFNVRLAMGAGRGRLVRQLVTESAVLAALAFIAGLVMAWTGSRLLVSLVAGANAPFNVEVDVRVLAFTLGLSMLAVMLFGLFPAIRASRLDLAANLRARGITGGLGARGQRFPVGKLMIAGQIALSLVMLMGAALLVKSLRNLEATDVGFDRDHILMLSIDSRARGYAGDPLAELTRTLTARLSSLPGVRVVTYSENGVFSGTESNSSVLMPGWQGRTSEDSASASDQVGPRYAAGLGARLIEGRDLGDPDAMPGARRVALVNQSFARFYFGQASPIGRSFRLDDTTSVEIVGVVGDVKDHRLDADASRRFYTSYNQQLDGTPAEVNFEIRVAGDPARLMAAARAVVLAQDPLLAIETDQPLAVSMRDSIAQERLLAQVASGFGILALVLASIGLYGVMTYAVSRRTAEIGLRIALGAAPHAMIGMVLGDALRLVAGGVAVGVPLAWIASHLLSNQLHGVGPVDLVAAFAALVVLTAAAIVASIIPARRASRVSALGALNQS